MAEYLEPFVHLERPGQLAHELSLMYGDVRRADRAHEADTGGKPGDAGDIGRAALLRVRQKIRLVHAFRQAARAARHERTRRQPVIEREQQSRPHRAVQRLVTGHAHRREAGTARDIELENACRLRGVQNERHAGRAQQPPDLVERTDRAEHIGNMVQDEQLRPFPERPSDLLHHALRLPERRVQHGRVDAVQRERPHDRVVLEAAHRDLHPRSCERMDGDIERVRGVLRKYDARRVVQAEQCRRLLAAVVHEVSCALRRRIAAPRVPGGACERTMHRFPDRTRLDERRRGVVQIVHPFSPSYSMRQGTIPSTRSRASASPVCRASMRTAQPQDSVRV